MKKKLNSTILSLILAVLMLALCFATPKVSVCASNTFNTDVNYRSCVLIEKNSGKILSEHLSDEHHPIASVTKLMTVLLTLEKIDAGELSLDEKVLVSENANSMGGSQIFLDANPEYVLGDLLKSVIVASANDSSVAIAEHIAGSENNFVRLMNNRASELGLKNTHYSNCTGLPTPDGYSSAYDQAIILQHVLNFDTYHNYSSIWLEDFVHPSGRTTQMTNTNKLSRFYEGCTGGKTGSTNQAKYCLAVGAERNNVELIAVVLGADNSKDRFKLASDLLNFGFENFESKTIFSNLDLQTKTVKIKGQNRETKLKAERDYTVVFEKNQQPNFILEFNLPQMLTKVKENEVVGTVDIVIDGVVADTINILSTETHNEATIWDYFKQLISN